MKKALKTSVLVGCAGLVSGCIGIEGTTRATGPAPVLAIGADGGRDSGSLAQLEAGIYIDPDGCHIWMIDDGLEGYWSRRRDPVSGLPVCTEIAPPNSVVGDIGSNEGIADRVPRVRD
ncbi:MAG: hypothetical protein HLUCCA08_09665 [Rhodobacteraceae bacterium HLUCCA08]|nr:MAG: hypothetical protein HLUCCA08_09665 [Rhodobacteraceae bacterium HLUCCA08]